MHKYNEIVDFNTTESNTMSSSGGKQSYSRQKEVIINTSDF